MPSPRRRDDPAVVALLWSVAAAAVLLMLLAELTRPLAEAITALPAEELLPPEVRATATAYRGPLDIARLLSLGIRLGVGVAVLCSRRVRRILTGWITGWSARRADSGRRPWRPFAAAVAGTTVWMVADLARLPIGIWAHDRAVQVGLSVQPLTGYLRDWFIQHGLTWLGVALAVAAAVVAAMWLRRAWVPVGGVVLGLAGVAVILLSPLLFEPLLLTFTPAPPGELRQAVVELVRRADGVGPGDVLIADASRRTTVRNAYVSGLGATRRVVVFDTLVEGAPISDVVAIIGHEIAHQRHRDVERTALASIGAPVLLLAAVAVVLRGRLREDDGRPATAAGTLAVGLTLVLVVAVSPVERWSSRRAEAAADQTAIALTGDGPAYASMMVGLARTNLSDPDPPWWAVTLTYTHPPVAERITRALAAPRDGGRAATHPRTDEDPTHP